jgi:hypothetical protein
MHHTAHSDQQQLCCTWPTLPSISDVDRGRDMPPTAALRTWASRQVGSDA